MGYLQYAYGNDSIQTTVPVKKYRLENKLCDSVRYRVKFTAESPSQGDSPGWLVLSRLAELPARPWTV